MSNPTTDRGLLKGTLDCLTTEGKLFTLLKHRGEYQWAVRLGEAMTGGTISTAFAFDDHFRQFGNVTVIPG